ncbi:MAG: redoxin domain-containing protein, partial [Limisphaerales bacterium]
MSSPPPTIPGSTALATASLILGILAVVFSLFLIGGVLGLVGLILGAVYLAKRRPPRTMAWWGVGLSLLSIVATVGFGSLYYFGYKEFRDALVNASSSSTGSPTAWAGVLAPDLTVTTLDGETIQLSDLKGKRVILDFWATWCGPCVKEIPHFIELVKENSRDELVIVGISKEDVETLKPFVEKHGINYPIASADNLPSPYGDVTAIPTTFFIDRNGVIQSVLVGYHDLTSLRQHATAEDYQGEPRTAPKPLGTDDLPEREPQLGPVQAWSQNINGQALCVGDWDGDGAMEILVADGSGQLIVYDLDGTEKKTVTLPDSFTSIKAGKNQGQFRLLGFSNWGKQVVVTDQNGTKLWTYESSMGINGAHWGDLDGDGNDEMVVGM